jgi:hypothetical protein
VTVRERVVRGSVSSEHIVQFFDSDESRAESVAEFIADGYRRAEPVIVVVTPARWAGAVKRLEAIGIPVSRATRDGRIVVKDCVETLDRVSRDSSPDSRAFEATVGRVVAGLPRGSGRVRAYGEMVDLLAQRGDLADAIKLETFWNGLAERIPLFLLCGYAAAHFVATATHRALRDICSAHSGVHRHAQDSLADWVLNTAHNAAAAAALMH